MRKYASFIGQSHNKWSLCFYATNSSMGHFTSLSNSQSVVRESSVMPINITPRQVLA